MLDNRAAWRAPRVAQNYLHDEGLQPPEAAALALVGAGVSGRAILDIGVGTGRTTDALHTISPAYVGVDFSAGMVDACRRRHVGVDIRQMDARDLSVFHDRHFALVVFSYNGLDYVSHADRLRVLAGMRRVLADDGWLLFSSHNRASRVRRAWDLSLLSQPNPGMGRVRQFAGWLVGVARHLSRRSHEQAHSDHAILNDDGENFRFMTYYIDAPSQRRQLELSGFVLAHAFDTRGRELGPGETAPDSGWIYYLARKARA
ncbi:MAG: class I SAM-dependent methyltransferase [Alphaproteobacteria bacterium]|nr:class I SAM-dependent methyltransferase [Alphaproteobacteria bacterium]